MSIPHSCTHRLDTITLKYKPLEPDIIITKALTDIGFIGLSLPQSAL